MLVQEEQQRGILAPKQDPVIALLAQGTYKSPKPRKCTIGIILHIAKDAIKGIFIGYSTYNKGCKILDLEKMSSLFTGTSPFMK